MGNMHVPKHYSYPELVDLAEEGGFVPHVDCTHTRQERKDATYRFASFVGQVLSHPVAIDRLPYLDGDERNKIGIYLTAYHTALEERVKASPYRLLETYLHDGIRYVIEWNETEWSLFVYPDRQWLKDFHNPSLPSCFQQAAHAGYPIGTVGLDDWHE